jgi:hypothetical protein
MSAVGALVGAVELTGDGADVRRPISPRIQ